MKNYFIIILVAAGIILNGCDKEEEIIPNVSFSGMIYIPTMTENPMIFRTDINQRRLGVYGVVVYQSGPEEFYAFDLMCTNEKSAECLVEITDGATCTCPCCESRFFIVTQEGGIAEGPAKWSLKGYSTYVDGNYLVISN